MTNEELLGLFHCGASKLAVGDDPGALLASALSWYSTSQPTSTREALLCFAVLRARLLERHGPAAAELFDGLVWSNESAGLRVLVEVVVALTKVEPGLAS